MPVERPSLAEICRLETKQKEIMAEIWDGIRLAEGQLATATGEEERRRLEEARSRLKAQWTTAEQMMRELLTKKYQMAGREQPKIEKRPSTVEKKPEIVVYPSFVRMTPPRRAAVPATRPQLARKTATKPADNKAKYKWKL